MFILGILLLPCTAFQGNQVIFFLLLSFFFIVLMNISVMITSSPSNSIRMWIFDQSDNSGRLLRERTGHHAPPTLARYHGTENTRFLLSAGTDQALRFFHMTRDSANCELSQGHIESLSRKRGVSEGDLRLPIIIGMASRFIREREWDNIVTIHENCAAAFTWNFLNKKKGKHTLRSQSGAKWRACEISICGNYAILGSSNGFFFFFFFPKIILIIF